MITTILLLTTTESTLNKKSSSSLQTILAVILSAAVVAFLGLLAFVLVKTGIITPKKFRKRINNTEPEGGTVVYKKKHQSGNTELEMVDVELSENFGIGKLV